MKTDGYIADMTGCDTNAPLFDSCFNSFMFKKIKEINEKIKQMNK